MALELLIYCANFGKMQVITWTDKDTLRLQASLYGSFCILGMTTQIFNSVELTRFG